MTNRKLERLNVASPVSLAIFAAIGVALSCCTVQYDQQHLPTHTDEPRGELFEGETYSNGFMIRTALQEINEFKMLCFVFHGSSFIHFGCLTSVVYESSRLIVRFVKSPLSGDKSMLCTTLHSIRDTAYLDAMYS